MSGSSSVTPFERSIRIFLSVAILLALILPPLDKPWEAGASRSTEISIDPVVGEELEDIDGNGKAEHLVLVLQITVYVPGSYGVHGEMEESELIVANLDQRPLEIGVHELRLKFSGGDLTSYMNDGHYSIIIEVFSKDISSETERLALTTEGFYSHSDFEALGESPFTSVSFIGSDIVIESPIMRLTINRNRPLVSFSYSGTASSGSRTILEMTEIIAYNDKDGDGIWSRDADEKRYFCSMESVNWRISYDLSTGYDIALYGVAPLFMVGSGTIYGYVKIVLSFQSSAISPLGDSQKFDIDLELMQSIDADYLALVQVLSDDTGQHTLRARSDSEGFELLLEDDDGRSHGSYSWTDSIEVGSDRPTESSNALSWYELEEHRATIWFSYPMGENLLVVHHDPVVGMDLKNVSASVPGNDFLTDDPLVMLVGLLVGGTIVAATIIAKFGLRKSGGRRKLSDDRGGRGGG